MQVNLHNNCDHIIAIDKKTKQPICIKCKKSYKDCEYYELDEFIPNIDLNLYLEEYLDLFNKALSFDNNANSKRIIMLMHSIYENNKINNKIERIRK